MTDKPTLTLVEGRTIGPDEIARLYTMLTGRPVTADELQEIEQQLASGTAGTDAMDGD